MNTKITMDNYHTLEPGDVILYRRKQFVVKSIDKKPLKVGGVKIDGIIRVEGEPNPSDAYFDVANVILAHWGGIELLEIETLTARRIREAQARMNAWIELKFRLDWHPFELTDEQRRIRQYPLLPSDMQSPPMEPIITDENGCTLGRLVWEDGAAKFRPDPNGNIMLGPQPKSGQWPVYNTVIRDAQGKPIDAWDAFAEANLELCMQTVFKSSMEHDLEELKKWQAGHNDDRWTWPYDATTFEGQLTRLKNLAAGPAFDFTLLPHHHISNYFHSSTDQKFDQWGSPESPNSFDADDLQRYKEMLLKSNQIKQELENHRRRFFSLFSHSPEGEGRMEMANTRPDPPNHFEIVQNFLSAALSGTEGELIYEFQGEPVNQVTSKFIVNIESCQTSKKEKIVLHVHTLPHPVVKVGWMGEMIEVKPKEFRALVTFELMPTYKIRPSGDIPGGWI